MFDSVITPKKNRRSSWGAGVTIALFLHASSLALTMYLSRRAPAETLRHEVTVAFIKAPPPPPPPPPPPKKATPKKPKVELKPVVKKQDTIVTPKEIPEEKPEPESDEPDEGVEGGVEGGVPGGVVGGVLGGVVTQAPPPAPPKRIELSDDKVKLTKIFGPAIEYTQQALEKEIEGTMIVKCLVGVDGSVRNCRVLRTVPFMERQVVATLERWRYQPYLLNGTPCEVDYTFKLRLQMPR